MQFQMNLWHTTYMYQRLLDKLPILRTLRVRCRIATETAEKNKFLRKKIIVSMKEESRSSFLKEKQKIFLVFLFLFLFVHLFAQNKNDLYECFTTL